MINIPKHDEEHFIMVKYEISGYLTVADILCGLYPISHMSLHHASLCGVLESCLGASWKSREINIPWRSLKQWAVEGLGLVGKFSSFPSLRGTVLKHILCGSLVSSLYNLAPAAYCKNGVNNTPFMGFPSISGSSFPLPYYTFWITYCYLPWSPCPRLHFLGSSN